MTEFLKISGAKINLRDWTAADLPIWEYWLQPEHDWHKLNGPYYGPPSSVRVKDKIETKRKQIQENDWPNPREDLVIVQPGADKLIGRVNWYWQDKVTNWLSAGIVIYDTTHRQKGIGFESLGLWMDYLFDTLLDIVRLDLRTWSGNIGMMCLAEKLGYRQEACFRKARIVEGKYFDSVGYGILREEWEKLYPNGFRARNA